MVGPWPARGPADGPPTKGAPAIELLGILLGLILFDLAAWRWGADSTDGVDSPEWERRRAWRGFTRPHQG